MKWLIVLASLFAYGQVSAAGLCLPTADGEGLSHRCVVGWNGATNYIAYAGALSAMIDKFTTVIVYDSFANHAYWFGFTCIPSPGYPATEEEPAEPPGGCTGEVRDKAKINVPLATAFQRTLRASHTLMGELQVAPHLYYRFSGSNVPEINDKKEACKSMTTYSGIAPHWNHFADSFRRDYDAYQDKYRKKIFKHYFQAIKRLYGFYTKRMKRLMRQVKREYNCDF